MDDQEYPPLDSEQTGWDEGTLSRRQFFQTGFWTATGAASLILGGAGARFLVGDSFVSQANQWVVLGELIEFVPGNMHRVKYSLRSQDLWREVERVGLIYAYTDDGESFTVLEATCTHLGCNVRWVEGANRFSCPCHNGHYTREGEVIDGPPPKSLRRLETKVENGALLALV